MYVASVVLVETRRKKIYIEKPDSENCTHTLKHHTVSDVVILCCPELKINFALKLYLHLSTSFIRLAPAYRSCTSNANARYERKQNMWVCVLTTTSKIKHQIRPNETLQIDWNAYFCSCFAQFARVCVRVNARVFATTVLFTHFFLPVVWNKFINYARTIVLASALICI